MHSHPSRRMQQCHAVVPEEAILTAVSLLSCNDQWSIADGRGKPSSRCVSSGCTRQGKKSYGGSVTTVWSLDFGSCYRYLSWREELTIWPSRYLAVYFSCAALIILCFCLSRCINFIHILALDTFPLASNTFSNSTTLIAWTKSSVQGHHWRNLKTAQAYSTPPSWLCDKVTAANFRTLIFVHHCIVFFYLGGSCKVVRRTRTCHNHVTFGSSFLPGSSISREREKSRRSIEFTGSETQLQPFTWTLETTYHRRWGSQWRAARGGRHSRCIWRAKDEENK